MRQLNRLSSRSVATKRLPGLYADGGGLCLQLSESSGKISKPWIFRFRSPVSKRDRYMGLGPLHAVGLPEARGRAAAQRGLLLQGIDPIVARDEEMQRKAAEAAKAVTFAQCAASYIESHKAGWRNPKHAEPFEAALTIDGDGKATWTTIASRVSTYDRVIELYDLGLTITDMATELGVHKSNVSRHVKKAIEEGKVKPRQKDDRKGAD